MNSVWYSRVFPLNANAEVIEHSLLKISLSVYIINSPYVWLTRVSELELVLATTWYLDISMTVVWLWMKCDDMNDDVQVVKANKMSIIYV